MMTALPRVLGLPALTFYGVGVILGAGIYTIIGAAAAPAQEGLWLAFVISALVAIVTGLSYAELATMYPHAGAEYVYMRHAFPKRPWIAALLGYLLAAAAMSTAATVSLAFAGYFGQVVASPRWLVAGSVVVAATGLNIIGIRQSSWVNILFTLIEATGLVIFIVLGSLQDSFGDALTVAPTTGVFAAAALVFFAYLGFEDIANLAEETKDPDRTVPRALFLAIGISTVLYVLVAIAALALATPDELSNSEAPLRDALQSVDPRLAGAVGGIALFATANTALVGLIVASRILLGMARGGDLPKPLARVLPKRRTPWVGALVAMVVALSLLPLGKPSMVGSVAAFCSLLAFVGVNASLPVLRRRQPAHPRPFRVPLAVKGIPLLPLIAILGCLGLALQLDRTVLALGALMVAYAAGMRAVAGWAGWVHTTERVPSGRDLKP